MGRLCGATLLMQRLTLAPAVTLSLADADFKKLVDGKAKAQQLFMAGKLKIKGNMGKATKLESIVQKAKTKPKL